MDIPRFPESRPLDIGDQPRFDAVFAADPPEISEFTFTNLYGWRDAYGLRVSALDGFLVISSLKDGVKSYFKPAGTGDSEAVIARIAAERAPFIRIPEGVRDIVKRVSGFTVREDRDNADYVYSCPALIELKGKSFDGKRNLIKKFKGSYRYEYVELDGGSSEDCLSFQELWCITKGCEDAQGLARERDAVRTMCRHYTVFGLRGGAIRVDGRICAICIGQRLTADTLVMHVLKAFPDMPGLYQVMHNEFLAREARGYAFVNMEQDLGLEGLRKAKLSYHPVKMVNKFTLVP